MRDRLVYFHPDKPNGYGATSLNRWPKRLEEQGLDVEKGYIIERDLTIEEATRRERELQVRDGYPIDISNYALAVRNSNTVCKTKKAKIKRRKSFKEFFIETFVYKIKL